MHVSVHQTSGIFDNSACSCVSMNLYVFEDVWLFGVNSEALNAGHIPNPNLEIFTGTNPPNTSKTDPGLM